MRKLRRVLTEKQGSIVWIKNKMEAIYERYGVKGDLDLLQLDSYSIISFIVDVEKEFNIVIPDELMVVTNWTNKENILQIICVILNKNLTKMINQILFLQINKGNTII